MYLLVGLGNPGSGYARHRHNVGFMAVDEIARSFEFGPWKSKFQGRFSEGKFGREKLLCLKPDTYMNLSGQSVGEAMRFLKIAPENVFVFHDDLDLARGKIRTKLGGGHGGHNGLRSIDQHIGAEYHRVRIGIGHPGSKELVHGYVLQEFSRDDETWLAPTLKSLSDHLALLLEGKEADYLNKIALDVREVTKPEPAAKGAPGKVKITHSEKE